MLKDLDKRQHEGEQAAVAPHTNVVSKSPIHWLYILAGVLVLNAGGWYVWSLYSEVQSLKNAQATTVVKQPEQSVVERASPSEKSSVTEKSLAVQESFAVENMNPSNNESQQAPTHESESATVERSAHDNNRVVEQTTYKANTIGAQHTSITKDSVAHNGKTPTSSPLPQSSEVEGNQSFAPELNNLNETTSEIPRSNAEQEQQTAAKLSISRRELTPEEFVASKYQSAEKAVQRNELAKAENALEEVLLVDQNHKAARKQLAALWFGRQSYQPAINLLAQGLALDNEDSEMRMMQARIYLAQGNSNKALEQLKVMVDVPDKGYQSLLASIAQQVGDNKTALTAYEQLTILEPQSGKWWLGLAIAHDRGADFDKAKQAYQMAIVQRGLSSESLVFAQQRISELGE